MAAACLHVKGDSRDSNSHCCQWTLQHNTSKTGPWGSHCPIPTVGTAHTSASSALVQISQTDHTTSHPSPLQQPCPRPRSKPCFVQDASHQHLPCSAPSQGLRHLIAVSPEHQGHLSPTLGTPQHLTLPLPRHNTARDSQTEGAFGTSSTTALLPIAEQSPPLLPASECLQTLGPAQTEGQQQGSCFGVARKCPACPAACLHCSSSQAPGLELWLEKSLPEALLAAGAKASQGWSQVRVGHALCATAPQQTRQDWVPDAGPALH